jgi:hypothetical protein
MKLRLLVGAAVALIIVLVLGVAARASTARHATTPTIRGMVGGDFDTELPAGSVNGADWGVDASFQRPADNLITDTNVKVVGGQDNSDFSGCTGSAANPTAPRGKVCIYLIGSGGATNIRGVTPVPNPGGSRFGFKLIWDATGNGDTFVDAVWAYHFK